MSVHAVARLRSAITECEQVLDALRADRTIPATLSDYRSVEGAVAVMARVAEETAVADAAALAARLKAGGQ